MNDLHFCILIYGKEIFPCEFIQKYKSSKVNCFSYNANDLLHTRKIAAKEWSAVHCVRLEKPNAT
jgi:hypothetical protein